MDSSPAILMPSSLQAPQTQEQNGILDWLRKLRLHKYYPVFKQLTMEKVRWLLAGSENVLVVSGNPSFFGPHSFIPRGTELGFCSVCVVEVIPPGP